MKNLKKLSLEDEINREAEEIEKKVKENKEIEGMTVSEDMETALFNKIQEYEYDKRLKKVVYRKKKRTYVIGAIAAIIILICGSVMTSVGSKSYVKVLWERINGDESSNIIKEKNMKKRILSVMSSLVMAGCILGTSSVAVNAQENERIVDGSVLTTDDTSTGRTENGLERGIHLMDGECSISKAGISRVYCYGSTTANHEVDKLAVIVRVDQCEEDSDDWGQIDWFMETKENDYFVYATKSVTVERGYYYRVHASHIVRKGDDPVEETYSYTDGIKVP